MFSVTTKCHEIYFVKIECKFLGFQPFVGASEDIMDDILQVVTSGCEIIALLSFAKNVQARMHTHSPTPTHTRGM